MNSRHHYLALGALLATATLAVVPEDAAAREGLQRRMPRTAAAQSRPQPRAMLAVIGLREQRVSIYDAKGARIIEAPVSTGVKGNETPAGIFSVVEKNIDHRSNLYGDASMPYMQRLTWTGVALHEGDLPGYPASHGCVRLPGSTARQLFTLTREGMRVVIAREGIAPAAIAGPSFFSRPATTPNLVSSAEKPVQIASVGPDTRYAMGDVSPRALAMRLAAAEQTEAEASRLKRDLAVAAARAKKSAWPTERVKRDAEKALAKLEAELAAAEKAIAAGAKKKQLAVAEKIKAAAPARIETARLRVEKARADAKAKAEAALEASSAAEAAAAAHTRAFEAMTEAKQNMAPVSVFISRKTQRIYVRKAFEPLWEAPLRIRDADKPIGTFVFTAHEPADGAHGLSWSVVSLYKNPTAIEPPSPPMRAQDRHQAVDLPVTNVKAAEAALTRFVVPPELAARISEIVLPGSSLIISDEPPSIETGRDTDFVIVMSGEPKGALKLTKPKPRPNPFDSGYRIPNSYPSSFPRSGGFWFN